LCGRQWIAMAGVEDGDAEEGPMSIDTLLGRMPRND
jgi:hypothetical protein